MFDGSDTSLGGNGAPRDTVQKRADEVQNEKRQGFGGGGFGGGGDGGGCIETGPFVK